MSTDDSPGYGTTKGEGTTVGGVCAMSGDVGKEGCVTAGGSTGRGAGSRAGVPSRARGVLSRTDTRARADSGTLAHRLVICPTPASSVQRYISALACTPPPNTIPNATAMQNGLPL